MQSFFKSISILVVLFCLTGCAQRAVPGEQAGNIRLNQIGFYPQGPKIAVVVDESATKFRVLTAEEKEEVYAGELSEAKEWEHSKELVKRADFSNFQEPGRYVLQVDGVGMSYPFEISEDVHFEPAKAGLKAFYFQRASTELSEEYAGRWAREAGTPDTAVKVHNSAATKNRPAGSTISSPGGWYDAGDYGKYIVNSGITMGTLLSLYEDFPNYFDTLNLNIPESRNRVPDLLDENLYNLRWMMTMQDEDGGVYHKLTSARFHGAVKPKDANYQRWVVQKSTPATLDFSAVTAQAARIYRNYPNDFPGLADSLLVMSRRAYEWAKENPRVEYRQNELKEPEVATGAYGDTSYEDEFQWAAAELFITTGEDHYLQDADLELSLSGTYEVPSWPLVNTLALYSLSRHKENLETSGTADLDAVDHKIIQMADVLVQNAANSAYGVPMGVNHKDFVWGSNAVAANQGILLVNAYRITGEQQYLQAAIHNLDYLLGRNATGYSFLTGYGEMSTRDPHHRPSESDDVDDPVPGLLAGGPNPGQQDKAACGELYTEAHQHPATSYIDNRCSYASNEIAINWNAPFAYLANAIEALKESH